LKDGELREGVVTKIDKQTFIDIGVEHTIPLNEQGLSLWERVTVKIHKDKHVLKVNLLEKPNAMERYWGYVVNRSSLSLGRILRTGTFDLVVLTSRYGKPLTETIENIRNKIKQSCRALIAFGSPKKV